MPVSLILSSDAVPVINPLYYYRLQINREGFGPLVRHIPLDFLEQFAGVVAEMGLRGKFTVIPYPAGLGWLLDGWAGCDKAELESWLSPGGCPPSPPLRHHP